MGNTHMDTPVSFSPLLLIIIWRWSEIVFPASCLKVPQVQWPFFTLCLEAICSFLLCCNKWTK